MTNEMQKYVSTSQGMYPADDGQYYKVEEVDLVMKSLKEYSDKLAQGLPEGMLPKDIENIKNANAQMATVIQLEAKEVASGARQERLAREKMIQEKDKMERQALFIELKAWKEQLRELCGSQQLSHVVAYIEELKGKNGN